MQHFKLANWWIREFVESFLYVTNRLFNPFFSLCEKIWFKKIWCGDQSCESWIFQHGYTLWHMNCISFFFVHFGLSGLLLFHKVKWTILLYLPNSFCQLTIYFNLKNLLFIDKYIIKWGLYINFIPSIVDFIMYRFCSDSFRDLYTKYL